MRTVIYFIAFILLPASLQAECPSDPVTVEALQGPKFISSPNFPGIYGAFGLRLSCSWIIRAAPHLQDVVIQIQVLNSSIEPSTGCLRDSVQVVDGSRFFHTPLTSWCGSKFPSKAIVSTGPNAFVKFSTDFENNDYTGFLLAFWAAKKPLLVVNQQPWTAVNYALFGTSIVLFSSLLISFVMLGLVQYWQHYKWGLENKYL